MIVPLISLLLMASCGGGDVTTPDLMVSPGNDPNFTIVANEEGVLNSFNRKVEVFGIKLFAVPAVEDAKLLHAANLMAQYIDNNEDGVPDNQEIVDHMVANNAFMVLWKSDSDLDIEPPSGWEGQDLGNDETHPSFVANGRVGDFDAALEEVLHLITHVGYAGVYPEIFGEEIGSDLADAMDGARGGQFITIPDPYPTSAWYTYDDNTCDYSCMVTEYMYWSLTSILGAQENRSNEIQQEWRLNTNSKVETHDPAVFGLLTDPQYKLPTVLPDGTYRR